ncbi:hypothetical protein DOB14_23020 [Salmonella enterica subsp. enterica serovar Muenchen]|uniref:Secreted protein n=1 Tax=Salmonella muenchen TaxID=596 RepID=A0A5W3IR04_SALMU|nr:hypothetical protein [Salmonella enterica subsp. enterica serovar Muenchen]EBV8513443.1 hypothetical protein [Salmonella enterica subsp. enterica serovar Muenchen]EBW6611724.1 hypothetical protein [Salmonella enterica subsp. enterica serovar Muenchen]
MMASCFLLAIVVQQLAPGFIFCCQTSIGFSNPPRNSLLTHLITRRYSAPRQCFTLTRRTVRKLTR